MPFDALFLTAVRRELEGSLTGCRVDKVQQPLHLRLLHPDQPPARQMLAQQHAEHRRLRRVFRRFIRQVDARMIG